MAKRQSRISFRDRDKSELQRTIRNFNSKRRRLIRANPNLEALLPERQSLTSAKKDFSTRAEFKRTINSLKRFSKRGAEEIMTTRAGQTLTRFELKEIKNLVRIGNIQLARKRRDLGVKTVRIKGKTIIVDTLESGRVLSKAEVARLSPIRFSITEGRRDLKAFKAGVLKRVTFAGREIRRSAYVGNYAIGLGAVHDINGTVEQQILGVMKGIDADVIAEAVRLNPALAIDYIYKEKDRPNILQKILNEWKFVSESQ